MNIGWIEFSEVFNLAKRAWCMKQLTIASDGDQIVREQDDGKQVITTTYQVSGGNILPNPDALQEVRLLTSNFDAEFGRSPGGVLSAITRSGTSRYHGLAFDYIRNDAFNTSNYFLNGVTPLKQNQFGGDFGGPLWRGGKAFFFLSYEGLIIHTPAVVSANVVTATALERTGDFSQSKLKPTKVLF